jgi:hypothetical protein
MVPKVPVRVEDWWKIGAKLTKKLGRHLPTFRDATPCFPLPDKKRGGYG